MEALYGWLASSGCSFSDQGFGLQRPDNLTSSMGSNGLFGTAAPPRSSLKRTGFAESGHEDTLNVRGRAFDATLLLKPRKSLKHLIQSNARHKSIMRPVTADDPSQQIMQSLGWSVEGKPKPTRVA